LIAYGYDNSHNERYNTGFPPMVRIMGICEYLYNQVVHNDIFNTYRYLEAILCPLESCGIVLTICISRAD
jgi:hypothetical protein